MGFHREMGLGKTWVIFTIYFGKNGFLSRNEIWKIWVLIAKSDLEKILFIARWSLRENMGFYREMGFRKHRFFRVIGLKSIFFDRENGVAKTWVLMGFHLEMRS